MDRAVIAKLLEVDPQFESFIDVLYGISKMGDTSEVHVDGDSKRRALAGGLLLGTAAESAATARAFQNARGAVRRGGGTPGRHAASEHAPKHAAPAAERRLAGTLHRMSESRGGRVGEAALQGVNLAVGLGAAKELLHPSGKKKVSKGAGHFEPIGVVHSNARFRALGVRKAPAVPRPGAASRVGTQPNKGHVSLGKRFRPLKDVSEATKLVNSMQGEDYARHVRNLAESGRVDDMKRDFAARQSGGGGRHRPAAAPKRGHRALRPLALGGAGVAAGAGGTLAYQRREVQKNCEWRGEISKVDVEKRQVFGWASLSKVDGQPVTDRQGDYIPIEESEEAAYRYMLTSRKGGDMHARIGKLDGGPKHTADVIESVVFTPEKIEALGLEPDALPHGWWLGMQVHDEQQWQDIKEGKRTGFSVHGTGVRRDLELV